MMINWHAILSSFVKVEKKLMIEDYNTESDVLREMAKGSVRWIVVDVDE